MKGFLVVWDAKSNAVSVAQSIQQSLKDAFQLSISMDGRFAKIEKGCVLDLFCSLEKKVLTLFVMGL